MSEIIENEELLEEDEGIITLEDENGETVDFEFGDMIDYKGNSYAVLIPLDEEDTEIIIEVTPRYVEVWDTSDDNYAYQIFIDFEKQAVEVKPYDKKEK